MWLSAPLRSVLHRLGIDRAVGYVLLGNGWNLFVKPVNLYFTLKYLTPDELGFFYTIGSILALQVFFELGLGIVVQQFASHEAGHLKWTIDGTLSGDPEAKSRLASLLRKSIGWYTLIAGLITLVILPVGWYFFATAQNAAHVGWRLPWVWTVLATAGGLLVTPLVTLLNGCGQIAWTARIYTIQSFLLTPLTWVVLVCGGGLFTAPLIQSLTLLLLAGWLVFGWRGAFLDLWRLPCDGPQIHWRREVWPFQWRIAVSWLSGYFIFQLFNPVAFRYHGARAAGRLGVSLNVAMQIMILALTWVNTKMPQFGALIAQRRFNELNALFYRAFRQSTVVAAAGAAALVAVPLILPRCGPRLAELAERFLSPLPMTLLAVAVIANHIVSCQAAYLRAHRREPFLIPSMIGALFSGLSTYFLGRYFGLTAMLAGFCTLSVLGIFLGTAVFVSKRRQWHQGTPA
jgi:hypothetical protein